jgi:hypothetical protein
MIYARLNAQRTGPSKRHAADAMLDDDSAKCPSFPQPTSAKSRPVSRVDVFSVRTDKAGAKKPRILIGENGGQGSSTVDKLCVGAAIDKGRLGQLVHCSKPHVRNCDENASVRQ